MQVPSMCLYVQYRHAHAMASTRRFVTALSMQHTMCRADCALAAGMQPRHAASKQAATQMSQAGLETHFLPACMNLHQPLAAKRP